MITTINEYKEYENNKILFSSFSDKFSDELNANGYKNFAYFNYGNDYNSALLLFALYINKEKSAQITIVSNIENGKLVLDDIYIKYYNDNIDKSLLKDISFNIIDKIK